MAARVFGLERVIDAAQTRLERARIGQPGLGIELNEDVALAHPYTGTQLHLEMTNRPLRKEE